VHIALLYPVISSVIVIAICSLRSGSSGRPISKACREKNEKGVNDKLRDELPCRLLICTHLHPMHVVL